MAWLVVRDAFGEVVDLAPCGDSPYERAHRLAQAVHTWQQRGDRVRRLVGLKYQLTSFDGNVRVLVSKGQDALIVNGRRSERRQPFLAAARSMASRMTCFASAASPQPITLTHFELSRSL
jgi:hypothetical protein